MKRGTSLALAGLLIAAVPAVSIAESYKVDPAHSSVGFVINHLMIAEVEGRFDKFEGSFVFDEKDPLKSSVQAKAVAASINTNEADRDKHLRSPDFFDVDKYPDLTFVSKKVSPSADGKSGTIQGVLTIHGVTKDIVLDARFKGKMKDPWGNERAIFDATGKINRKDFGLKWNKALETGGFLVGDEVTLKLKVEGVPDKPAK